MSGGAWRAGARGARGRVARGGAWCAGRVGSGAHGGRGARAPGVSAAHGRRTAHGAGPAPGAPRGPGLRPRRPRPRRKARRALKRRSRGAHLTTRPKPPEPISSRSLYSLYSHWCGRGVTPALTLGVLSSLMLLLAPRLLSDRSWCRCPLLPAAATPAMPPPPRAAAAGAQDSPAELAPLPLLPAVLASPLTTWSASSCQPAVYKRETLSAVGKRRLVAACGAQGSGAQNSRAPACRCCVQRASGRWCPRALGGRPAPAQLADRRSC